MKKKELKQKLKELEKNMLKLMSEINSIEDEIKELSEEELNNKMNELSKRLNDNIESIKSDIEKIIKSEVGENRNFLQKILDKLCDKFSDIENSSDRLNHKVDDISSYLKNEVSNSQKEREDALNQARELTFENETLKSDLEKCKSYNEAISKKRDELVDLVEELKSSLSNLEEDNEKLKSEKSDLEKENDDLKYIKTSLEHKNSKLEDEKTKLDEKVLVLEKSKLELENFKSVFLNDKVNNLLEALLNNSALQNYREKNGIIDKSPQSIFNLVKYLSNPKVFIESYYNDLVEYKKINQSEMGDDEVRFYLAINEYFDEEAIINPDKKRVEGRFDKSTQRGINMERVGEIDDGIVLIPSDNYNNDKIKVKVK